VQIRAGKWSWFLFIACAVFGFSTASFLSRRKYEDPRQSKILATLIAIALLWAWRNSASVETAMLAYVPPAVCLAMVVSISMTK
jgi:uncharacterized membrane protein YoaK (UPF0700 family)